MLDHDRLRDVVAVAFKSFFRGWSGVVCIFGFSTSRSGFRGGGRRSQIDDLCIGRPFAFLGRWCGRSEMAVRIRRWDHDALLLFFLFETGHSDTSLPLRRSSGLTRNPNFSRDLSHPVDAALSKFLTQICAYKRASVVKRTPVTQQHFLSRIPQWPIMVHPSRLFLTLPADWDTVTKIGYKAHQTRATTVKTASGINAAARQGTLQAEKKFTGNPP